MVNAGLTVNESNGDLSPTNVLARLRIGSKQRWLRLRFWLWWLQTNKCSLKAMNSGAVVTALTSLGQNVRYLLVQALERHRLPDHAQRPLKDAMIGHLTSGHANLTYQEK